MSEKPARRRWYSLSLRALIALALVLVLGVPMAWKARRVSVQKRAVARIQALHGSVTYDWEYAGNPSRVRFATGPSAPGWLRKALGNEYFQEVAMVMMPANLPARPVWDDDAPNGMDQWGAAEKVFEDTYIRPIQEDRLACLDGLDSLRCLDVRESIPCSSEVMARLGRLAGLKELDYKGELDSQGFRELAKLTNLESLFLQLDSEKRPDFAFLDKMPRLRTLNLAGGAIPDAEMARIGRVAGLEHLILRPPSLTDSGFSCLKELHSLISLGISRLGSDANQKTLELHGVEGLTNLRALKTFGIPVSKAGLDRLRKLSTLKSLMLYHTRLDDADIEAFKFAMPGVMVDITP